MSVIAGTRGRLARGLATPRWSNGGPDAASPGKTEVIRRQGPWRHLEALEFATFGWVDWFNHRRLLGPIGDMPPAEYEARYYDQASVA